MTKDLPEHLTVAQVAEHLNVTTKTVRRWIAAGGLKATRVGPKALRVSQGDLQDFLERSNG